MLPRTLLLPKALLPKALLPKVLLPKVLLPKVLLTSLITLLSVRYFYSFFIILLK
jgi:hypothetical protein